MKAGTICKLKVECLGNKAGTLGVVFYDYGDGFQAIFENGNLDDFSVTRGVMIGKAPFIQRETEQIEANYFLEEVGFEESLAGYQFKDATKVTEDYMHGVFSIAWTEGWKKSADGRSSVEPKPKAEQDTTSEILRKHKVGTEKLAEFLEHNHSTESDYEKCEVYADGNKIPLLKFNRKHLIGESVTVCMLSDAMDFVDFSHFEYSNIPKSIEPRWMRADKTICPLYVVFRKKL